MDAEAIQILREIRDEAKITNERIEVTNDRLEVVETTVLELAEQQRFVVRHLRALSDRDHRLEADVIDLRRRVDKIEDELDPQ